MKIKMAISMFSLALISMSIYGESESPIEDHPMSDIRVFGRQDGRWVHTHLMKMVGKEVVIQGVAWGEGERGLGPRIVFDGGGIYVNAVDFKKKDVNGKLVEIRGALQFKEKKPNLHPRKPIKNNVTFYYYNIEAASIKVIDRAERLYVTDGSI